MTFPDLDKKATIQKTRSFLEHDFQRIRRYASYEGLITSPIIDGQPHQQGFNNHDSKFINHTSNCNLLAIIIKAMDSCTGDGPIILKQKYFENKLAYQTYNELNISMSTYTRHLNHVLLEFADCLYFLTHKLGNECIDLRVLK